MLNTLRRRDRLVKGKWLSLLLLCTLAVGGRKTGHAAETGYETIPLTATRPALDRPTRDPAYAETLTRRTDPSQAPGSTGLRHEYSRFPPANADNTLLILQVHGGPESGQWQIRELNSGQLRYTVPTQSDPEFSWHASNVNKLLYRYGNS